MKKQQQPLSGLVVYVSGALHDRRLVRQWTSTQSNMEYLRSEHGRDVYELKTDSGLLLAAAIRARCTVALI